MGIKQHATEQPMGERRNQKKSQKYLETWKCNIPTFMGCSKSSSKREVCSDKCLLQEVRKVSNNLTLHLKELGKEEQMKPKVKREEITKVRAEIN